MALTLASTNPAIRAAEAAQRAAEQAAKRAAELAAQAQAQLDAAREAAAADDAARKARMASARDCVDLLDMALMGGIEDDAITALGMAADALLADRVTLTVGATNGSAYHVRLKGIDASISRDTSADAIRTFALALFAQADIYAGKGADACKVAPRQYGDAPKA